jgi:hypothetical protein
LGEFIEKPVSGLVLANVEIKVVLTNPELI